MNIDTGKVYPSKEAAIADGVSEDRLVTGTRKAITALKRKLFPKRRRARLKARP